MNKIDIFKQVVANLKVKFNVIDIDYNMFGNRTCILIRDVVNTNNRYCIILDNTSTELTIQYVDIESGYNDDLISVDIETNTVEMYVTIISAILNYYMYIKKYTCGDMYCENICDELEQYNSDIEYWFDIYNNVYMYTVKCGNAVVQLNHLVNSDTIECFYNVYNDEYTCSANQVVVNEIMFDMHENTEHSIAHSILLFFNAVKNMSLDNIKQCINSDLVDY